MVSGLPDKLTKLRLQNGLSQQAVAKRLGLSASVISGYETGTRTPSIEVIVSLSRLYGCSCDYLLGREQVSPTAILDVSGLTVEQLQALQTIINAIRHE